MTVVGAPQHPQLFVSGFDDTTVSSMRNLVERLEPVESPRSYYLNSDYRLAEWDGIVACETDVHVEAHMNVLAFGCSVGGIRRHTNRGERTVTMSVNGSSISSKMAVADDLGSSLKPLVAELVDELSTLERRPHLTHRTTGAEFQADFSATQATFVDCVPWILDADGHVIAGEFSVGDGVAWLLPLPPARPDRWLDAALTEWNRRNPAHFPLASGWRTRPRWRSRDEMELVELIDRTRAERDAVVARFTKEIGDLESSLIQASAAAEGGRRRLLTDQSDVLAARVLHELRAIGFDVVDLDDLVGEGKVRGADLFVTDKEDPDWAAIVEVKGYSGGAKTNDLAAFERHERLLKTVLPHAAPTHRWYVVNAQMNVDPDLRQSIFQGAEEDVEEFALNNGLVIDTRELFDLLNGADTTELGADEARLLLRSQTGRL